MVKLIVPDGINMRLDKFLSENLDHLSRSKIQNLISNGNVIINDKEQKSSFRLTGNESIAVYIDEKEESTDNHLAQ